MLGLPENRIDFNLTYLDEQKLVTVSSFTFAKEPESGFKINCNGVDIIEHKEENKNRYAFLNANIPFQIENKIGLINL